MTGEASFVDRPEEMGRMWPAVRARRVNKESILTMQQGEFLRHRARPEWGIGQVLSRGEDRIDVQFRHALVLLKVSVAAAFLERVSKAEAALAGADTPPRKEGSVKTPRASKKASKSSPEAAR